MASSGVAKLCTVQTHLNPLGTYLACLSHAAAAFDTAATLLFILRLALIDLE